MLTWTPSSLQEPGEGLVGDCLLAGGEQLGASLEVTTSVQNLLLVPSVESMAILPGS